MNGSDPRRQIPPVHQILEHLRTELGLPELPGSAREAVRSVAADARARIVQGEPVPSIEALCLLARQRLTLAPSLRRVINATGILLHTGLGRAPILPRGIDAIHEIASGYCDLEFSLDTGNRGQRTDRIEAQLQALTGAEAAAVVNNNAAATILALRAMAAGREVVVSRGQLVEIGGSFRLPEIFEVSGARLHEVGTTNICRASDYERAIGPETAALLRVHTGNYRIVGFTESVPIAEIARIAHSHGLIAIDDIGSGALAPGSPPGIVGEPNVAESLAAGADLILFSGDKLLGGPQCGILLGKTSIIRAIQADPLMRAFRVDKLTIAALGATIDEVSLGGQSIPLWKLLATSLESLQDRANQLVTKLNESPGILATAVPSTAFVGGGSVPADAIPSWSIRIPPPVGCFGDRLDDFARTLRTSDPAVVGRIQEGAFWLDLRSVDVSEDILLSAAISRGLTKGSL